MIYSTLIVMNVFMGGLLSFYQDRNHKAKCFILDLYQDLGDSEWPCMSSDLETPLTPVIDNESVAGE